jgi:hypothetical protein
LSGRNLSETLEWNKATTEQKGAVFFISFWIVLDLFLVVLVVEVSSTDFGPTGIR